VKSSSTGSVGSFGVEGRRYREDAVDGSWFEDGSKEKTCVVILS